MRHISRTTKAATAVAGVALTVLAGTGVAMAAGPGAATAPSVNARTTSGQLTPGMTPAGPKVDVPTSGDVRDNAKADAETADGAKDTDKIQQGDQVGSDNVRDNAKADAETADGAKDTDKVPQGDRMGTESAQETPATSTR